MKSSGYQGLFPWGKSVQDVEITTYHHIVPRSRMVELYLHSPIRLHDVVLNQLSTGATLPLR
jgi:hypothetical protein